MSSTKWPALKAYIQVTYILKVILKNVYVYTYISIHAITKRAGRSLWEDLERGKEGENLNHNLKMFHSLKTVLPRLKK